MMEDKEVISGNLRVNTNGQLEIEIVAGGESQWLSLKGTANYGDLEISKMLTRTLIYSVAMREALWTVKRGLDHSANQQDIAEANRIVDHILTAIYQADPDEILEHQFNNLLGKNSV